MEGYSRYRLGGAFLICQEYVEAEKQLTRAIEILTLEDDEDWEDIIVANKELAKALIALGREDEANERLERIKEIVSIFNLLYFLPIGSVAAPDAPWLRLQKCQT
jgi:hypothetical protein